MAKSLTSRVVQSRRRRPAGLSGIIAFSGGYLRAALVLLMIGLVLLGGVPFGSVEAGWAQGAGPSSSAGSATFQSGQITANLATGLQMDHKHYPLDSIVTITDDEGRARELKDLVPGSRVQFHLKQGRIDKIVLILPK